MILNQEWQLSPRALLQAPTGSDQQMKQPPSGGDAPVKQSSSSNAFSKSTKSSVQVQKLQQKVIQQQQKQILKQIQQKQQQGLKPAENIGQSFRYVITNTYLIKQRRGGGLWSAGAVRWPKQIAQVGELKIRLLLF